MSKGYYCYFSMQTPPKKADYSYLVFFDVVEPTALVSTALWFDAQLLLAESEEICISDRHTSRCHVSLGCSFDCASKCITQVFPMP